MPAHALETSLPLVLPTPAGDTGQAVPRRGVTAALAGWHASPSVGSTATGVPYGSCAVTAVWL